ncbi:GNAT family N-acetyltransferase [Sphingomonas flavalba]|uniref:GNAT family N-acetyltransferase n=1 Tax=Sphingomonas flavalba TaxID=2559804 RepID=UPI0039E13E77
MAAPVTITVGGMADLDAVMLVMADSFDPTFGEAWTDPQCVGILGMIGSWLLVARVAGVPAGFALSRAIAGEGELLLIGVRPQHRQRGIGTALLDRVTADARALGVTAFHLEVREGNPAIALYERNGFHRIGRRPNYYRGRDGTARDALTYKRDLSVI